MARYRVKDSYLSEEEYRAHRQNTVGFWIATIVSIMVGVLTHILVTRHRYHLYHLPHSIKFTLVLSAVVLTWFILFALRKTTTYLFGLAISLLVLYGVGYFVVSLIWHSV